MRKVAPFVFVIALAAGPAAADQRGSQPTGAGRSGRARVIGAIVGAAGGFVLGIFAGLTWFDDAVNSDRKVWTTAVGFGAAGGVGGYLIGRRIDGNRTWSVVDRDKFCGDCARPAAFVKSPSNRGQPAVPSDWAVRSLPLATAERPQTHAAFRRLFSADLSLAGAPNRTLSTP